MSVCYFIVDHKHRRGREDLGFDLAAVEKVLETASRFRSRP